MTPRPPATGASALPLPSYLRPTSTPGALNAVGIGSLAAMYMGLWVQLQFEPVVAEPLILLVMPQSFWIGALSMTVLANAIRRGFQVGRFLVFYLYLGLPICLLLWCSSSLGFGLRALFNLVTTGLLAALGCWVLRKHIGTPLRREGRRVGNLSMAERMHRWFGCCLLLLAPPMGLLGLWRPPAATHHVFLPIPQDDVIWTYTLTENLESWRWPDTVASRLMSASVCIALLMGALVLALVTRREQQRRRWLADRATSPDGEFASKPHARGRVLVHTPRPLPEEADYRRAAVATVTRLVIDTRGHLDHVHRAVRGP